MSKTNRSQKDKEMAAELKRRRVTRTVLRCPICNRVMSIKAFQTHIAAHK